MKLVLKELQDLYEQYTNYHKFYVQLACLESFLLSMTYLYTGEQEELAPIQGQVARKKRKRCKNRLLSTKYLGCII